MSSEGRGSRRDVALPNRLWAAMQRLNPELPEGVFLAAADELTRDRSRMLPAEANREVHRTLLEGVKVKVPGENGAPNDKIVRLINWRSPEANEYLLASQLWVSGELYPGFPK